MTDVIAKLVGEPPSYGEHLEVIETIWLASGVVRVKLRTKKSMRTNGYLLELSKHAKAYVETLDINWLIAFPMWSAEAEFERRMWEETHRFVSPKDLTTCRKCGEAKSHFNHDRFYARIPGEDNHHEFRSSD